MNLNRKLKGISSLLLISVVLTACGPTETPAPTIDANQLFTQAAMTVVADITKNAPTITPTTAATNTPVVTNTPLGALPTLPPLATLPSLATAAPIASSTADKAQYVTQSPSDNTTVKTGQVFNITWRLQNIGTTTWNTNYVYRYYSSSSSKIPTGANGYNLTTTVAPNATVDLTAVATAPSTPGTYHSLWVITNPEGVNFGSFDLTVVVVQGTTSSGSNATAVPIPGNACEDTGYTDREILAIGAHDITVPGGQVVITYRIEDKTIPANMKVSSPVHADDEKSVDVTSTTYKSIGIGTFSKDETHVYIDITGGPVDIKHIQWWRASKYCP